MLAGLAACSTGARNWTKSGGDDNQRNADYAECRSEMRAVTKQSADIDQDITASRGGDWRKMGDYGSQRSQLTGGDADYAAQIMQSCMTDKGYRPL
ncbi:MAG TPA: hypothetical protein VGV37_00355 [Aliidongia sp.]|uniref:hypothetical protein n=1 Tax=Aliidongia sp. TaxID=1914230 RepID=UPI002DDDB996|nr:hypothetical protein [Aliidongia sp.]HEV2672958.1 hypothetical protein [Aliidongia sp.]